MGNEEEMEGDTKGGGGTYQVEDTFDAHIFEGLGDDGPQLPQVLFCSNAVVSVVTRLCGSMSSGQSTGKPV